MINRSHKYNQKSNIPALHAGQMLTAYCQQHKVNIAALARQIGVSRNSAATYFKPESLQMGILWKVSQALEHNFFRAYADTLPFGPESTQAIALRQQLQEKESQIMRLQAELEIYKRIVGK